MFEEVGYNVSYKLLNAKNFLVPQERKRVFIVGYRKDLGIKFNFPKPPNKLVTLKAAIGDLSESKPAKEKNYSHKKSLSIPNHEHMLGKFSTIYMSRNRKKEFNEPSFTIQASGRHAPIHPKFKPMKKLGTDNWEFDKNSKEEYRRLSIRECARIQTFPDEFIFFYDRIDDGYKMIGNAVPVKLAELLAKQIYKDLIKLDINL